MTARILYLVPPEVSCSSIANLQSLVEGFLPPDLDTLEIGARETSSAVVSGPRFKVEVAVLGKRHACLLKWLAKRGVATHEIPVRGSVDAGVVLRVRRFLMRQSYELVHVWQGGEHLAVWGSALLGAERVLVDQTIPDCALPGRAATAPSSLVPFLKRRMAVNTQALVQRFDSAELTAASAQPRSAAETGEHSHVIPPGVEVREKRRSDTDQAAAPLRASLGLPPDAQLIGVASGFRRGGGGKDAVWAADLLKCVRDDTHVLLFGDGPLRWRLQRFRWQTETEDRVHFVDESRFAELLPQLFCFWQPTHTAGEIQSLLSAMAAGVPVIVSDLPCHRQIVIDEQTGILVTPGNRGSLARKTDLLIRDDTLRRRLGAAGRSHAKEHFLMDHQISRYANLYREVLAGAR